MKEETTKQTEGSDFSVAYENLMGALVAFKAQGGRFIYAGLDKDGDIDAKAHGTKDDFLHLFLTVADERHPEFSEPFNAAFAIFRLRDGSCPDRVCYESLKKITGYYGSDLAELIG